MQPEGTRNATIRETRQTFGAPVGRCCSFHDLLTSGSPCQYLAGGVPCRCTMLGQSATQACPRAVHDQEPLVEIGVRDHGRGIAPEELSAIFQRFYRGDTSLTRETNGLGLGLALCQAIVAQHRGMLWVESALGEGSTFHVVLPRRQTVPDQGDNV